ncbi:glycine cleavage system aminomethyltransferase GcvT [Dasania sp. GY-MA-18]|uniref:aminomethyltransferase n=1 Tax=Dasania phycosphaerae TaxID=2950436 RepID=A0A9J6RNR8_9GAMM|nr:MULTISPECIES: glycine cleavage system aminomethyltransferase GcvT [Dasania]MCR8923527.1 glycine cleavage system aminomethyltransferase GcvT [Dasania sp. GY-MA-18]MCZ0865961.1 glycine cleavage system aminomethyltransferase GcvT [Dasania phycosphaerae]MCZ0869685.1 glycine cleavage system aminomethyltransferase GcvT [Dasania phycosphaerae]
MSDSPSNSPLLHTPLYDLHLALGAKMVPFAGYAMPVQYPLGVLKEHNHCREQAGLFDVSHMGQVRIKGAGITEALEALVPVDLAVLPKFKQSYAVFTNEQGGILDDLMITRLADDEFFLVVNAACKEQDIAHLRAHLNGFDIEVIEDHALLALQGPQARAALDQLIPSAAELRFMSASPATVTIDGAEVECFVSCAGYTGEDGYEISIPAQHATAFAQQLLALDEVEAIGLGARDSLRLEVGLCLYGHDLDTSTTPVEAGLLWSISKSRRPGGEKAGGYPGADIIAAQIENGASRKRVGLKINGRAPVREGAELMDSPGNSIGRVTSGGFGPTVGAPVAMGYVSAEHAAIGSQIAVLLRGKTIAVEVVKMPFTPQNYVR